MEAPIERSSVPSGLVGRERELTFLLDALQRATAGRGSFVLMSGEAGLGKSALVDAIASAARAAGCHVLIGHCYDLTTTPPFGPWREIIARLEDEVAAGSVQSGLVPDLDDGRSIGGAAIFVQMRDLLTALAVDRPVLVVLEDLHWGDHASLDLLRMLTRAPGPIPCLVIATYRVDELHRRHLLYQLLPALVRENDAQRLELRPLGEAATAAAVINRHPLPPADVDRLVAYLMHHAEGNPLYIRELLRTLEEEGVLCAEHGAWSLGDLGPLRVPALIQQVIEGRIARLGDESRDALAVAAVIGHDISIDLWCIVSGFAEEAVLTAVERAVEANILWAPPREQALRFSHALVRQTLYEGIVPPRRRIVHRKVASALSTSAADPDVIAYHLIAAGDPSAWEWLVRAGERAQRAYAWRTAADRFEAASTALEGNPDHALDRGWLSYRIGRLLRSVDNVKSVAYLEEAERTGRAHGDHALAAYALFDRGTNLCIAGQLGLGLRAMELGDAELETLSAKDGARPVAAGWVADSLHTARDDGDTSDRSIPVVHPRRGTLVFWLSLAGRLGEARALAERYLAELAAARRQDDVTRASGADANFGLGVVCACLGDPQAATDAFSRALGTYRSIAHHMLEAVTCDLLLSGVVVAYDASNIAERQRLWAEMEDAYERAKGAVAAGLPSRLFWGYEVLMLEGAWSRLREEAEIGRAQGDATARFYATSALAQLACLIGESARAWKLIEELMPHGVETEFGTVRFRDGLAIARCAALLAIEGNEPDRARGWIDLHDRWLALSGSQRWRAEGRLVWAQLYAMAGQIDVAIERAREARALALTPVQPIGLLAAELLLGTLYTRARHLDDAERCLVSALALADSCRARYERARALLALAELRIAQHAAPGAIADLAAEARELGEQLGATAYLRRLEALLSPPNSPSRPIHPRGLSAREVDVLRLVAQGMTNASIASELSISPRTVQNHLTRLYGKLDVTSRSGATRFAVEHGLV